MSARLHYIHDPLCGWCYGSAPLIEAALDAFGPRLSLALHAGGLFVEAQPVRPALASQLLQVDERIAAQSGQPFGDAYRQGLLAEDSTVLHSLPPIHAVLAAERIDPALAWPMLEAVQRAHYQQGLRVADPSVLEELADSLGIAAPTWQQAWQAVDRAELENHLDRARALMQEVGAQGFPTLLLEQHGQLQRLDHARFFGQPNAFVQALADRLDIVH